MIEAKRYRATSMPEALKQIKSDLGPDAIIVHAQPIHTGGLLGLFSKRAVEVRAAALTTEASLEASRDHPRRWKPRQLGTVEGGAAGSVGAPPPTPAATPLRRMRFGQFSQQLDEAARLLARAYKVLQDEGVEDQLVQEIILQAKASLTFDSLGSVEAVHAALGAALLGKMPGRGSRWDGPPRLIFLLGPTGVGKTTTAAKLAGLFQSQDLRPALATTDVFRVGAIAQLEAYARIMDLPFAVAYRPEELAARVKSWTSCDVVLVDSPGVGQAQTDGLAGLRNYVQALDGLSTYLVLSATAKIEDMLLTVKTFKAVAAIDGIIATKLDESSHLGGLYTVLCDAQSPLQFIANGPQVPEHLAAGGGEELISRMLAPLLEAEEESSAFQRRLGGN